MPFIYDYYDVDLTEFVDDAPSINALEDAVLDWLSENKEEAA
jgi:hypothetical protein